MMTIPFWRLKDRAVRSEQGLIIGHNYARCYLPSRSHFEMLDDENRDENRWGSHEGGYVILRDRFRVTAQAQAGRLLSTRWIVPKEEGWLLDGDEQVFMVKFEGSFIREEFASDLGVWDVANYCNDTNYLLDLTVLHEEGIEVDLTSRDILYFDAPGKFRATLMGSDN